MEYIIAGLRVAVPREFTPGGFGTAMAVFAAKDLGPADLVIEVRDVVNEAEGYKQLDKFDFPDADADCYFGRDAEGYLLTMTPRDGSAPARFRKAYDSPLAVSNFGADHHPALARFGVWVMFNITAVARQAVAIHSSVICYNEQAVLFLGESGTGKSTHTRLWREHIPGATLLNDDSPIVRIMAASGDVNVGADVNPGANAKKDTKADSGVDPDAKTETGGSTDRPARPHVQAFGAPWSGKTPCYRNVSYPIRGIVRLSQAPHNSIRRLRPIEAIGALLPSCPPSFSYDQTLQDAVCSIISAAVAEVPVHHLECLPDAAAAELSFGTIFGREGQNTHR